MKISQIVQNLDSMGLHYALYFHPRGQLAQFYKNQDQFRSASLIKVPILLSWLWLEKEGVVDRNEICDLDAEPQIKGAGFAHKFAQRTLPYSDVLLMMIATSDNLCTNLILQRIGFERLNDVFQQGLGLQKTVCQRKLMDYEARNRGLDNWVNADECVRLYSLIQQLNSTDRCWVDSLLRSCTDGALLARNLPRDTVVFHHKSGSTDNTLNDWGYTSDCEVFLLTNDVQDEPPVFELFGYLGEHLLADGQSER